MMTRIYTYGSCIFKDEDPFPGFSTSHPKSHKYEDKMEGKDDVPSSDAETDLELELIDPSEMPPGLLNRPRNQYSIDQRNLEWFAETEDPSVCTICWEEGLPSEMTVCSECQIFSKHIQCGGDPTESNESKRKKTERKWICNVCNPRRETDSPPPSTPESAYKMAKDPNGFMEGLEVLVRWDDGCYYKAWIVSLLQGKYQVMFENGDVDYSTADKMVIADDDEVTDAKKRKSSAAYVANKKAKATTTSSQASNSSKKRRQPTTPLPPPSNSDQNQIPQDDAIQCRGCRSGADEDRILLCDGCTDGFWHTYCLHPPLDEIPSGSWHCPDCLKKSKKKSSSTSTSSSKSKNVKSGTKMESKSRSKPKPKSETKSQTKSQSKSITSSVSKSQPEPRSKSDGSMLRITLPMHPTSSSKSDSKSKSHHNPNRKWHHGTHCMRPLFPHAIRRSATKCLSRFIETNLPDHTKSTDSVTKSVLRTPGMFRSNHVDSDPMIPPSGSPSPSKSNDRISFDPSSAHRDDAILGSVLFVENSDAEKDQKRLREIFQVENQVENFSTRNRIWRGCIVFQNVFIASMLGFSEDLSISLPPVLTLKPTSLKLGIPNSESRSTRSNSKLKLGIPSFLLLPEAVNPHPLYSQFLDYLQANKLSGEMSMGDQSVRVSSQGDGKRLMGMIFPKSMLEADEVLISLPAFPSN
eukprot:TRINITY_DN2099_c0_g1_i2.p1 TRINITY_DN2099_c0_g1~~TRINITY_DN2099_c0_g1_i2.p1  ORF type:complete len:692 (-),score=189.25 TRINITY_DN2099_c0_g1_i2:40-2115(-)